MTAKLKSPVILFLSLLCVTQAATAESSYCAFTNNESDWGLLRFASATAAIEIVETHCEDGDHLMVSHMWKWDAGYFIATMCDPSFQITSIKLDDQRISLNCVYVANKIDRFE